MFFMLFSVLCTIQTVVFANPVSLNLYSDFDPIGVDDYFTISDNPKSGDPTCVSMDTLSDNANIDLGFDSDIFRRTTQACPSTRTQTSQIMISPTRKEDPDNICEGRPYLLTCEGPQIPTARSNELEAVINCIAGEFPIDQIAGLKT